MNINVHTSSNVIINYDTFNELYIVIEPDGTSNCTSADYLITKHNAKMQIDPETIDVEIVTVIEQHQKSLKMFKDVPFNPS